MSFPCPQCGETVEVPTIRKLAEFALSVTAKKETKTGHSARWLGPIAAISLIVSLIGLYYGGSLAYERYSFISQLTDHGANLKTTEEEFLVEFRKSALQTTPADTWDFWNIMVNNGLRDPSPPELFLVKRYLASQVQPMFVSFVTGGIALTLFALSTYLMQKSRN